MVFFLNADEQIYGRFGGRDGKGPETRMSLAGLHYAMEAALATHAARDKAAQAPKSEPRRTVRDVPGARRGGRCFHCHEVNETLNAQMQKTGEWTRERVWRYPPPDTLGLVLEVDRGNVVKQVEPDSSAGRAGLLSGDVVQRLNGLPVHSFADAQYALDRAPATGTIPVAWKRGDQEQSGDLALFDHWRRNDISWRPSLQRFVPSPRLHGDDLSEKDKQGLGLPVRQLAFRLQERLHSQLKEAGLRPGDIVIGIDNKTLEMDSNKFYWYVRRNYLVGDRITVNIVRDGERLNLTMVLSG
jgi:S1-C subfamily serine protease